MARQRTPSFVAEFPLRTTPATERLLDVRFEAARNVYNAALGESLRRFDRMRNGDAWEQAGGTQKGKERTARFRRAREQAGFTSASIQTFAEACRDACWIGDHLGSHDTQTTSLRAFRAAEQYAYGVRGRPRFKGRRGLHSVEGKGDAVIRLRDGAVHWLGLILPLMVDPRDSDGWQAEVLACRTKYVRIMRRTVRRRVRWYCQLVQEGLPPQRRAVREGVVGADLGPSMVAVVAEDAAVLERFCPEVEQPWAELRRLERALDRSRRATNPDNYNSDGTIRQGPKRWVVSGRYRKLRAKRAEIERRLASERKRAHGELCNRVLGQGTTVRLEALSYRAWQKSFGRSVKVRAPGTFVAALIRKAERAGGWVEEIDTRTTRLSQYDHATDTYERKPLSQRWHALRDGSGIVVQRDLYSAFLARHVEEGKLDARKAKAAFPGAEPLLRRAASSEVQSASGRGFSLPPILRGGGADRPSKARTPSGEADSESPDGARFRILRL